MNRRIRHGPPAAGRLPSGSPLPSSLRFDATHRCDVEVVYEPRLPVRGGVNPTLRFVPVGGGLVQEVSYEEVASFSQAVFSAVGVSLAGQDQKIEILVCLDERIHESICRFGRDVAIEFADKEQQLALQLAGIGDVGLFGIVGPDRIAHPLLVP